MIHNCNNICNCKVTLCNNMVNESYIFFFLELYMHYCGVCKYNTIAVQWNIHVHCCRHICPGAYANTVKFMCMYSSAAIHIVDFVAYIRAYIWIYLPHVCP